MAGALRPIDRGLRERRGEPLRVAARTSESRRTCFLAIVAGCAAAAGCGTTRTSNTARTATEQLLISDAIDRTVESVDFSVFRDEAVFFDERHLLETVDKGYLISSFRQHLLASGAVLKDTRDQATYVIEPRVGAVGTDNHDLLFGIPAVNMPQVAMAPTLPAAIPEIPFAKRRDQQGIAKLAVFAYRRESGEPVWQSGIVENRSTANDIWVLGAGPFQRGTIYDGTRFVGKQAEPEEEDERERPRVAQIEDEAVFRGMRPAEIKADPAIVQASAESPVAPPAAAPAAATAAAPPAEAAPAAATAAAPAPAAATGGAATTAATEPTAIPSSPGAGPPLLPPPKPISEAPVTGG
jgi:hypothetical protein